MSFIVISMILGFLLSIVAMIILVTRVFYPYYRWVAFTLYAVSWIPFLIFGRLLLLRYQTTITPTFVNYELLALLLGALIIFGYIAWVVLPIRRSPLLSMSEESLRQSIHDDAQAVVTLHHDMQAIMHEIQSSDVITKQAVDLTNSEKKQLRDLWHRFFETAVELDILTNKYKGFYRISNFKRSVEHSAAFLLAYFAFTVKYHGALFATTTFDRNKPLTRLLNEMDAELALPRDSYNSVKQHLINPDTLVRLNAGRLHLPLLRPHLTARYSHLLQLLSDQLTAIDKMLGNNVHIFVKHPLDYLEHAVFKGWFPIQKRIALHVSYIRASRRDYFISPDVIGAYQERFEPGDILLERREWHATNVGIPGFWCHSALYTGTLSELDEYFRDIPRLAGASISSYLREHMPHVYAAFLDESDFPNRIIESRRPGVVFLSLEDSANADSLAVLRPRVSKVEKFDALLEAFSHLGKPYDFEFDFATDNELVCSELIFKAYQDIPGLTLTPTVLNGRTILPPNNIAMKFADEFARGASQLDLVLFLDGNEKQKKVFEQGVDEFIHSCQRPKWHVFVQEERDVI